MTNQLFYGDNLDILRNKIVPDSIDLIYLDPPFNSSADYNVLFKQPAGNWSQAQMQAFADTWHWGEDSEYAVDLLMKNPGYLETAKLLQSMLGFLGRNDMMAYIAMLAVRLVEMHRVLKPTGTIYLHCDPTAGHYIKLLMDSIFSAQMFRNEIVWCYRGGGVPRKDFARKHDLIYRYTKTDEYKFNVDDIRIPYSDAVLESSESRYDKSYRANKTYEGYRPNPKGKHPEDWWEIQPIMPSSHDRLGYPTQKPKPLLDRIISASSDEGDVVLDPFCGCGTTVHSAESLKRQWIGVDITHIAVSLIERRIKAAFPSAKYEVHGVPLDIGGAQDLAKRSAHEFQLWAVSKIPGGLPYKGGKKGADEGLDGFTYFKTTGKEHETGIISVKSGKNVGQAMIRELKDVVDTQKATLGIFVTLTQPTSKMVQEAVNAGFFNSKIAKHRKIQIITVEELLAGKKPDIPLVDEDVALKKAAKDDKGQQSDWGF